MDSFFPQPHTSLNTKDLQPEPSAPRNSSCVNLLDHMVQRKRQAFVLGSTGPNSSSVLCYQWRQGRFRKCLWSIFEMWIIIYPHSDAEAEAPILWPPDAKSWLIRKDPDAGKDWGQEEKGMTENEMVGCHHRLSGHEFEQTPGDSEGQGSLACCSP